MDSPNQNKYSPSEIDIAIPTKDSGEVIKETLERAARATKMADVEVANLRVVDALSDDETLEIIRDQATKHNWEVSVVSAQLSLPEARQLLIEDIDTDWFWFLDDDVRVAEDYLDFLSDVVGPRTGAVQGRKVSKSDEIPTNWLQWRARRGGTHATLIRREAVKGIDIPSDLHVLEDEYIRRYVDLNGFVWQFNHLAYFKHDNQNRHPVGWKEGYLGGKYGLSRLTFVFLTVPFAVITGREVIPHIKSLFGWLYARLRYREPVFKYTVENINEMDSTKNPFDSDKE